jgi:hypothetical protein
MAVTSTINVSGVAQLRYILVDTTTFFFTGAVDGQKFILILQQDGTGGRTVVSGNVPGIPQPDQAAAADTIYFLVYDAASNDWAVEDVGALDSSGALTAYTVAGAITVQPGLNTIGGASAQAYTLAAPVSGAQANGGQDGLTMVFTTVSAFAHTITTPANKINGSLHIITFTGATAGLTITLQASGGVWYVIANSGGTLS